MRRASTSHQDDSDVIAMNTILDLETYPFDRLDGVEGAALVTRCKSELASDGMFNLAGFLRLDALARAVAEVRPVLEREAFTHRRRHNIYFKDAVDGLAADHPALRKVETVNHTVCGDQLRGSIVCAIHRWPPLARFLAEVMGKAALHPMADEMAGTNVMAYRDGEALNWHFDRSEFTTTLLLQAPLAGGAFEYRRDLRSDDDPNYAGVAALLEGRDTEARTLKLAAGTLNVFKGKNTAHRVTPVTGGRERIIAVFSFFETPGVMFSAAERIGFYGRAN
jgi:predicted 2-oxoglutarate/Fe(II)-dependent dioxygenase YbiX